MCCICSFFYHIYKRGAFQPLCGWVFGEHYIQQPASKGFLIFLTQDLPHLLHALLHAFGRAAIYHQCLVRKQPKTKNRHGTHNNNSSHNRCNSTKFCFAHRDFLSLLTRLYVDNGQQTQFGKEK